MHSYRLATWRTVRRVPSCSTSWITLCRELLKVTACVHSVLPVYCGVLFHIGYTYLLHKPSNIFYNVHSEQPGALLLPDSCSESLAWEAECHFWVGISSARSAPDTGWPCLLWWFPVLLSGGPVEDVHGEKGRITIILSYLPQSHILCSIFVLKEPFSTPYPYIDMYLIHLSCFLLWLSHYFILFRCC